MEQEIDFLKEPYNPTDPIVVIDPEIGYKVVLKTYDDPSTKGKNEGGYNALKDDGINIPVIRLNNITLIDNQIDFVKIYFDSFLPKVHLSIKDTENVIKICDTPGYENEINIVIICDINGYYKKISLLFYITDFKIYGDYIAYDGVFKLQTMNTHMMKQIGKGKLNTYNMLLEIAKENKLGFAATEECEKIKDERYRLIQTKTYIDYINEQINIGGLNEESIFDAWIDIFGYIVMINVSYVMNVEIDPNQLMIYSMVGMNDTFNINDDSINIEAVKLPRTLIYNKTNPAQTNIQIDNFEVLINNNNIYNNGCLNTNYFMSSPCSQNIINTEQIQIIENSIEGESDINKYEFSKTKFIGIEFSDTPFLFQKQLHQRYFDKLRTKRIKVELTKLNLGLERGTLVNVIFKEYNNEVIKLFSKENNVEQSADGKINPFLSGIFYIDSIIFEYKTENHKIQQYLYLIKKSIDMSPINKLITPNI